MSQDASIIARFGLDTASFRMWLDDATASKRGLEPFRRRAAIPDAEDQRPRDVVDEKAAALAEHRNDRAPAVQDSLA